MSPATHSTTQFKDTTFDRPLLWMLNDVAKAALGVGFIVVYPSADGWGQSFLSRRSAWPSFCQLVQITDEGSKHCKMCHVLMAVAACTQGTSQQKCHTGVSVFVAPISLPNGETLAIISSCVVSPQTNDGVWLEARKRGKELGIDLRKLKKAYGQLCELDTEQTELLHTIIGTAAEGIKEIAALHMLERKVAGQRTGNRAKAGVRQALERALRDPSPKPQARQGGGPDKKGKRKGSALVEVVASLVNQNPGMPFSVSEIVAAARMTPNHFSTLFRQCKGKSFLEYLTEQLRGFDFAPTAGGMLLRRG